PEPARVGGEQEPLRLRRRALRLSRRGGDRHEGDDDNDGGEHTGADRGRAPRTCGATLHGGNLARSRLVASVCFFVMGPWRGHTKLARFLVVCVVAAAGVIVAVVV